MCEKEQEKVDARVLYLAGLFEGEGCASITTHRNTANKIGYQYCIRLDIDMTDIEPIKALHNYFGGSFHIRKRHEYPQRRETYRWRVRGKNAAIVAQLLIPYILTPRKRGALQCVINFAKTIGKNGKTLTPEILQRRENLYQKCHAYNARGINANNRDREALQEIEASEEETTQLSIWTYDRQKS